MGVALKQGRRHHACGMYDFGGEKYMIVAGGYFRISDLTHTEMLSYSKRGSWTPGWTVLSSLPQARYGVRGVSLGGVFHVLGGYIGSTDQILAWNPATNTWVEVGSMGETKRFHAITEISDVSVA